MRLHSQSWLFLRKYTTASKAQTSRLGSTVSLDHFLQRGKAIALWRTVIRDCRRIKDEKTRAETLGFAREEFKRNKNIEDLTQIRYLISTGKTQWDGVSRYIDGL